MIKYYCDICENEIERNGIIPKLGVLDFTKDVINLCNNCDSKFNEAKETLHSEYEERFNTFKEDYLEDLKEIILAEDTDNNVDPEPVWENTDNNADNE